MKKVFIVGINGKMGKMLCETAEHYGYVVSGGFDVVSDGKTIFDDASKVTVPYDVIIDFSRACPQTLDATIALCKKAHAPAVIATTGYCEDGLNKIAELSKHVPVFHSANMSIGIAATKAAILAVKSVLGDDFDVEIVEKHHNQKIDSPSGTALLLADALCGKDKQVINRAGKRAHGEVGVTSVRGGNVVGEHEIGFYGNDEIVTVSHSARSRKLFAVGAYKAADFVLENKKGVGLYSMDDLVASLV